MPAGEVSDSTNVADSSSTFNCLDPVSDISSSTTPMDETNEKNKIENTNENSVEKSESSEEWIDILGSGQLKMKTIVKGEPDSRPQPNDVCEIKLKGTLDNGTVVENFDSLKIQLGCHEVVQGVELAVPLMNVGEEAVVVVADRFAYGTIGSPPAIPPNATITYNVILVNAIPEPDLEQIPFEKRKSLANSKKERGNWWYSRQDSTKAIQCYRKALDILDETVAFCHQEGESSIDYTEEQMRDVIEQKLVIYNNLAAAQLQIEAYDSALMSVNRVLQCEPKNVKALFRKGKILTAKGQTDEAIGVYRQALTLEPDNSVIKVELSRCVKVQQTEKQHEKNLCRKMFGQNNKNDKSYATSKKKNTPWTKMLGTAASATVMAAVAFAVCYKFKNYSFI